MDNDGETQEAGGWDDWGDTNDNADGQDEVVEDWETAEDPDEVARRKQEEAEKLEAEKQAAIEAEKQRKLEKKLERERRKEQQKLLFEGDDVDGLFDVDIEAINENKIRNDFMIAQEMFGDSIKNENVSVDNIFAFKPVTVAEFKSYREALVNKINSFFEKGPNDKKNKKSPENKIKLIQFLVNFLTDDYKGTQIHDLYKNLSDFHNNQLASKKGKAKAKKTTQGAATNQKTFIKTGGRDDDFDDGFDDLM